MNILIFAEQFKNGGWDVWEHTCSPKEVKAVVDSALARARARSLSRKPNHDDFLYGARSTFDVMHGAAKSPDDGDTRVYCVCIGQLVIGDYDKIRHYSHRVAQTRESLESAMEKTA
jgi:hypothetical protein